MDLKIRNTKRRFLAALTMSTALLAPAAALSQSQEVTLKSADGTVSLVGDFVEFADNNYVIRTGLGDLRISAARVSCEGAACPSFGTPEADVAIAGADGVAIGVMPLLLAGYATNLAAEATVTSTAQDGQIVAELVGEEGFGDPIGSYLVTSSSSADGFNALLDKSAKISMASRRILPTEARALRDAGGGNMIDPSQEHIIALDSLIVITNPANDVNQLTTAQLRGIYSGQITNWSQVGGQDAPIVVVDRPKSSGTGTVFHDRVLGENSAEALASATVIDTNNETAAFVNSNPNAIGYVGYAFQRGAQPVTLVNECGLAMTPDTFSARTEEYELQRFLYLYNRADTSDAATTALLDYATSDAADEVIAKAGFIDLGVGRRAQSANGDRARQLLDANADTYESGLMQDMLSQMVGYDRLSTTFRFRTGSASLDPRGLLNMQRLADYLADQPAGINVLFVGFTDDVGAFDSNRDLSVGRAQQVLATMRDFAGDRLSNVQMSATGFGEVAPTACNNSDNGRRINRRVEVWITANQS